jgi:cyclic-di-GMP phosphodiesterase TipF (flagellum assembly factor)
MAGLTGWLIAGSMVVIAASISSVLYFSFGLPLMEAGWIGVSVLAFMLVGQLMTSRRRDMQGLVGRLDEIGASSGKVSREMNHLSMRIADLEVGLANRLEDSVDDRVLPLIQEVQRIEERLREIADDGLSIHAVVQQAAAPAPPVAAATSDTAEVEEGAPEQAASAATADGKDQASVQGPAASATVTPLYRDGSSQARDSSSQAREIAQASSNGSGDASTSVAATPDPGPRREGKFAALSDEEVTNLVKDALEAGRVELFLQPMVTLPQRKVRYYEALARLRTSDDQLMTPDDFLPVVRDTPLMAALDATVFVNAMQIARRLMGRNREVGLFINVAADTLLDERFSGQFIELAEHNSAVSSSIMLEMTQADFSELGPLEQGTLDQLADFGFRFSIDHVSSLAFDAVQLAAQHVRFVKVPAPTLLVANSGIARDIHPADISDLLARSGIELIAERIERESEVVDLIDYDVRLAQGYLFSPPRPVRADLLAERSAPPAKRAAAAD